MRDEQVEIGERRRAQSRVAGHGWLVEDVDGLAGPIVARARQPGRRLRPQIADGALLADDHPRLPAHDCGRERSTAGAGRNDVRTDMAERRQPSTCFERGEASEPASRDVLQEHPLDRLLRAEGKDLVEARVDGDHTPIIPG
jgi:hypothetical protein